MKTYFAKFGKVFGPFNEAELDELQRTGKTKEYSYIFKEGDSQWRALDIPPPIPGGKTSSPTPLTNAGSRAIHLAFKEAAVGFDHKHVVAGQALHATESGCELHTNDHSLSPAWMIGGRLNLNLLNETGEGATNKLVKVCGVEHSPEGWKFQLRWL